MDSFRKGIWKVRENIMRCCVVGGYYPESFDSEWDIIVHFTNHFIPTRETNISAEAGMHRPEVGKSPLPYKSHRINLLSLHVA